MAQGTLDDQLLAEIDAFGADDGLLAEIDSVQVDSPGALDWAKRVGTSALQGLGHTAESAMEAGPRLLETLGAPGLAQGARFIQRRGAGFTGDLAITGLQAATQAVDAAEPGLDPRTKQGTGGFFATDVPQGIGSSLALAPAAVGGPLGLAAAGASAGIGSGLQEANQAGATTGQALAHAGLQGLLGTTEAFGAGKAARRMFGPIQRRLGTALLNVAKEGGEEAIQEGLQTLGEQVSRKMTFAPDTQVDLKAVGRAALAAMVSGGLISGGVSGAQAALGGEVATEPQAAPEASDADLLAEIDSLDPTATAEPQAPGGAAQGGAVAVDLAGRVQEAQTAEADLRAQQEAQAWRDALPERLAETGELLISEMKPTPEQLAEEAQRLQEAGSTERYVQDLREMAQTALATAPQAEPAAAPPEPSLLAGKGPSPQPLGEGGAAAASSEAQTQEEDAYFAKFQADTGVAVKRVRPKGDPNITELEERAEQSGARLVWFDPEGGRVPAGAHMAKGLIFLDATQPAQARRYVFNHELWHELKQRFPDVAQRVTDVMREADPQAFEQRLSGYLKSFEGSPIKVRQEMLEEESAANTVQDFGGFMDAAMRTPESLQAAVNADPGLWRSIADAMLKILRRIGVYRGKTFQQRASLKALSEFAQTAYEKGVKPNAAAKLALEIKQAFDLLTEEDAGPSEAAKAQQPGEFAAPTRYAAAPQTDSPAFKRWFKDSKVVDEKGQPKVVYHGSPDAFTQYDEGKRHQTGFGGERHAFFFTDSQGQADYFASTYRQTEDSDLPMQGANVQPVYLRMTNPLVREFTGQDATSFARDVDAVMEKAKRAGHDGMIWRNVRDVGDFRSTQYAVFKPEQVKSATGNRGTFDPQNPDTRYAAVSQSPSGQQGFSIPDETAIQTFERKIQERFNRVRVTQGAVAKQEGKPLPEDQDIYQAIGQFPTRVAAKIEDLGKRVDRIAKVLAKAGISLQDAGRYLYARHAPRRNALIATRHPKKFGSESSPGSGMRTSEAQAIVQAAESGPQAQAYKRLAAWSDGLTAEIRQTMEGGGLISTEERAAWEAQFGPEYVPLLTVLDDPLLGPSRGGKGFKVSGKESKRAEGRASEASNPLAALISRAQEAHMRIERNRVGRRAGAFVRNHPAPDLWKHVKEPDWRAVQEGRVFTYKEGGVEQHIEFADAKFAKALSGVGTESVGKIMRGVQTAMRVYGGLRTTWDIEFLGANLSRDVQTAALHAGIENGTAFAAKVVKGIPVAIKTAMHVLANPDAKGPMADSFREFRAEGGMTGFIDAKTIQEHAKTLEKKIARVGKAGPMAALRGLQEHWENAGRAVENGVRFSFYVESRKAGVSPEKSASGSQELTVRFSRKGEWGPVINAAYLFGNARIQGSARMLKLVATNHTAQKVAVGLFAAGFLQSLVNSMLADDDKDGENHWFKRPGYQKATNLILETGGPNGFHVKLPQFHGWNVFTFAGVAAHHVVAGAWTPGQAAGEFGTAAMDAFNPLGGGSFMQTIAPTAVDIPLQVVENKTFSGAPQRPENFGRPDSEVAFPSTPDVYKDLATWMNRVTGGSSVREGAVSVSPETLEYAWAEATGGPGKFLSRGVETTKRVLAGQAPPLNEIPVVRRFLGEADERYAGRRFREIGRELEARAREVKREEREEVSEDADALDSYKDAKKDIEALYEELDEATGAKERSRIEREIQALQQGFIREARAVVAK